MSLTPPNVIEKDKVVKFQFILRDGMGNVVDSSDDDDPMAYLHGHGQVVLGLERAMTGRSAGDIFEVRVPAHEGYGDHNPDGIFDVERSKLPPEVVPEVGVDLASQLPDGTFVQLHIIKVGPDAITVDANHPFAGMELHFRVQVMEVRAATAEEIEHGHAHEGDMAHGHDHHHHHNHQH